MERAGEDCVSYTENTNEPLLSLPLYTAGHTALLWTQILVERRKESGLSYIIEMLKRGKAPRTSDGWEQTERGSTMDSGVQSCNWLHLSSLFLYSSS